MRGECLSKTRVASGYFPTNMRKELALNTLCSSFSN
jgi:hypothetical protein